MQYFIPPCIHNCPVNTNIPGYIDAIIRGEYAEAYKIIREKNPFPSVCAWVCPHPCENYCRRGQIDEPLNIRGLKRFAVEQGSTSDVEKNYQLKKLEERSLPGGDVAVIGGGPSGLAAAYELVCQGFSVTVLDRHEEPGGHFYASLPLYRLPRDIVRKDVSDIIKRGAEVFCGVEVGSDVTVEQLREKYRSVILAAGLQKGKKLPIPGSDNPSVLSAVDYLQGVNLGNSVSIGKKVIVIGGGDVAMDAARTALRQGVESVTLVCLEAPEEMPANEWEIQEAREEGIEMYTRWGPKEIEIAGENNISGLHIHKVTRVFDEEGKFSPQFDSSNLEFIPGDNVIMSVGQAASLDFVKDTLQLDSRGNVQINKQTLDTGVSGVFACGEVAEGPGPAISAVASGRRAAENVEAYLNSKYVQITQGKFEVLDKIKPQLAERIVVQHRLQLSQTEPEERKNNLQPFEKGYTEEEALQEASRCLRCGMGAEVDLTKCIACLTCMRVCPYGVAAVDSEAFIPSDICQACGLCAASCPRQAITIRAFKDNVQTAVPDIQGKVPIKLYVCRRVMGREMLPDLQKEIKCPAEFKLSVLPCSGALNSKWVLDDLEQGFYGVAIIHCDDECTNRGAAGYRDIQFKEAYKNCQEIDLDTRRLKLLSSSCDLLNEIAHFSQQIVDLGPTYETCEIKMKKAN
ncbi:MAG: FAD-dependent oxidoreductase [Clostridiales bacterium]|nr:FAD-dependent oxidoreductase [Clostridiales bacterium]MCF8021474.1 FAD-dependent oxidoreductase [Clostridiales bacterium]